VAKRIFSLIISFVMLISCVGLVSAETEEKSIVRFGVFSDTHNNADGINNVFNNIYALSDNGEALDGVIMNGDIVYMQQDVTPAESHYATLLANEKYQELKEAGKLVYEMGNHEFPLNSQEDATLTQQSFDMFKEQTGFDTQMHTVLSGYHFINAAPENYSGGMQAQEEYMRAELDKALADGSEKPVFLVVHHPVPSSVIDSPGATSTRFSVEFREYLNSQPRIIVFSGHTHEPETDPRSIRQYVGGCTYVATSHVAGGSNVSSSYASQSHSKKVSQAMMMEIDKDTNVVTFKRFYVGKTAPQYLESEDWVIDIPAMINAKTTESEADDLAAYKYTFEDRSAKGVAPVFEAGSTVKADNIAAESVKLTFPKAIQGAEGDDNLIKFYEMKVTDLNSAQVVKTEAIISDYFLKESERRNEFSHTVTGLSQETSYKIDVCATTSWYKKSKPISVEFQTLEKEEFEDVTFEYIHTAHFDDISNDNNSPYYRDSEDKKYIQIPNTASTHKFTATFNLTEKGMYRFMSGSLGATGAPVTAVIKKVEENGEKTHIKTAEVYVATGGVSTCIEVPFADVVITEPGTYTLTWSRGASGSTATLYNLQVGKFGPLPVEYLDEYSVVKTAAEYSESSETVEEGTTPESFTLNTDGFVTWEFAPYYPGKYTLNFDFDGAGLATVTADGMTISGDTISSLPSDSEITQEGLTVYLFDNTSYKFTFKATSDNTIVNGMTLTWHENFVDLENDSYKFTYAVDTDLAYQNIRANPSTTDAPNYYEKEIFVPIDANYTVSLNAGLSANGKINMFIERVKGGTVSISSTGATSTIENRIIFTDVPLIGGETYKITIFNATSGKTLRLSDIVLETSGVYNTDIDDLTILASDYSSSSYYNVSVCKKRYHTLLHGNNITYKLNPGAGTYKVYATCRYMEDNPEVRMYINNTLITTYSGGFVSSVTKEYEFGTIRVTDDEFTLKLSMPTYSSRKRVYIYDLHLVAIDSPEVVMYSGETTDLANVTTTLTEGSITAKAYLPKALNGKNVTMYMAIYEDNSLYKVDTYSLTAKKNSIAVVTLNDIEFKEGKTYKSKVFFWENSENMIPLYGVLQEGCLTN